MGDHRSEKFGGGGLDTLTACLLEEELGKTFIRSISVTCPSVLYAARENRYSVSENQSWQESAGHSRAMREPSAFRPEEWQTTASWDGAAYHPGS
jgi:hypothetical protein